MNFPTPIDLLNIISKHSEPKPFARLYCVREVGESEYGSDCGGGEDIINTNIHKTLVAANKTFFDIVQKPGYSYSDNPKSLKLYEIQFTQECFNNLVNFNHNFELIINTGHIKSCIDAINRGWAKYSWIKQLREYRWKTNALREVP